MLPKESIKLEINIPTNMRDGTVLYADIWRPDTGDRCPAVLTRLPYNKNLYSPIRAGYLNPQRFARAGYAVVIQDVRGTGVSEGKPYFWQQETKDGYDTVEWVASQPWCDGNVGMYGLSYFGYTQWAAAVSQPPHLRAICPALTQSVIHSFPFSNKGDIFKLQTHLGWCVTISTLAPMRSNLPPQELKSLLERLVQLADNIQEQYRFLPIKDAPAARIVDELGMVPPYSGILAHAADADYWKQLGSPLPLDKVAIPVFHIGAWNDPDMTSGVLASYHKIKERGGSEFAAKNQKLLIGPWIHSADMINIVGDLDFGIGSSGAFIDVTGIHIRWFDYWLKGIKNGVMDEPPVRIFVMGDNVWRDENEWPLARVKSTKYYLHSNGMANSRFGDGTLSTEPAHDEQADRYLYDPRNPVPTKTGVVGSGAGILMGAYDQQEVEKRTDVLVYTSEPMKTGLEVTGPIMVKLYASSSAVDTDFTVKLVDVWPDGKAFNLLDGIIRARYRESDWEAKLITPGKVYEYSIDLGATSNVFKTGHQIRVEISSSSFPKWDRNLNTGHSIGQDAEIAVAVQTIYHDKEYPSHIVLPVIA